MPPEGSTQTGSSTDSPKRGTVGNGKGKSGKGKANARGAVNGHQLQERTGSVSRGVGDNGNNARRVSGGRSGSGSRLEGSGRDEVTVPDMGFHGDGRDDNSVKEDAGTARLGERYNLRCNARGTLCRTVSLFGVLC